jgi:hypothetical protein
VRSVGDGELNSDGASSLLHYSTTSLLHYKRNSTASLCHSSLFHFSSPPPCLSSPHFSSGHTCQVFECKSENSEVE